MNRDIAIFFALAFAAHGAFAQAFPNRAVRLIVPFAPGGTSDASARLIGQKLTALGWPAVVIDNRPGAAGNIAAELAAKAPPDGYTLFLGTHGTHAINSAIYPKLPYDPVRDFRPVGLILTAPNILLVHPSLKVNTVAELVELAKARPGAINFASGGAGSMPHMSGELLNHSAGIKMTHIPYKGDGPAFVDVLGGDVPVIIASMFTSIQYVSSSKLKPLALTSTVRSPLLPAVQTMREAGLGLEKYESLTWTGLFAPAGTPDSIMEQLNRDLRRAIEAPDTTEKILKLGGTPRPGTRAEFTDFLAVETARWSGVAKAAGIRAD